MVNIEYIIKILPNKIEEDLKKIDSLNKLQEIRIKINKPIIYEIGMREMISSYIVNQDDLKVILQRMSEFSIYAFEEEIKRGYITIKGGHRIGICGRCVIEGSRIKTIRDIASVNIRICREILGCSNRVMPYIIKNTYVNNTIIISPPKCGKTTLIRDIARNVSNGIEKYGFKGKKVCIIDERSEIGACYKGVPQMKVGIRTDVLDGSPKSEGIMMAIRSMSPEVIICDEIGTYNDMDSIIMALNSGINLITTIHGFGIEDLFRRNVFKKLIDNNVFKKAIILNNKNGVGTIEYIYDFDKKNKLEVN
ncbi:hypothetical protein CLTEP_00780 [Clostridium tepidiprofundi DSM 19306]|uniref:AAA+ ATPase domain-containing protein n=1 Tax=Clostridium tepidiprofundi DSM 19306 TaxID=1121338 RepID=A0A151B6Y7_9CLOT|nr:stage III sporulation protein AA [Clostridium tepidiprofundi]KYH35685.1 hypothetical protein CLTEP_00780 [Clostridium tepidiprofundi DSM 19306]